MTTETDDRERFEGVPRLPNAHLGDEQRDLWDDLAAQADALPDGPDRDEVIFAMRRFVDRVKEALGTDDASAGNEVIRREFVDPRGRLAVETTDDRGSVRRSVTSREETERLQAEVRAIVDERQTVRDLLEEARLRRSLAFDTAEAGSQGAADTLRTEADALDREASAKLEELRKRVPPTEWESYELGRHEQFLPGVEEALIALHRGKTTSVYEQLRGFDQAQMEQFMRRVPKEDAKFVDALLGMSSDELEQAAAGKVF